MAKKNYQVQTRQIKQITNHPDYQKGKDKNNLALVELKTPVKLSKGLVDSVKLPSCSNMRDGRKSKGRTMSPKSQTAGPFIQMSIKFPGQKTFIDLLKPTTKVNKKGGQHNIRQRSKNGKKQKGTKTKRSKGKNQKKSRKGQRNGGYYPNVYSRDSNPWGPMSPMPSHMGSMSQWGSPMHYAAIPL